MLISYSLHAGTLTNFLVICKIRFPIWFTFIHLKVFVCRCFHWTTYLWLNRVLPATGRVHVCIKHKLLEQSAKTHECIVCSCRACGWRGQPWHWSRVFQASPAGSRWRRESWWVKIELQQTLISHKGSTIHFYFPGCNLLPISEYWSRPLHRTLIMT